MFKHLTHTLKLGLAALTILTAGAGAAFATHDHSAEPVDIVNDCSGDDIFSAPSYCTVAVVNCIAAPFDSSCATTLGTKAHTVAKVRYCGEASHRAEPACASTVAGVNAASWAKQNPDAAESVATVTRGQKRFVKGTASGLDVTGVKIYTSVHNNSTRGRLNFSTAEFNDRALGGEATDGVAFFFASSGFYAGILSGTDLGAPVDNPAGTTASWVGQLQTIFFDTKKDFVLEVTFGGTGDNAGSIEAFVHRQSRDPYYNYYAHHFHLKGDFDDSGLITGTIDAGKFTNNDREDTSGTRWAGVLTGLIGQEGAVGVFHSNGSLYAGGFVARPPTTEPKEGETYTETKFLNDTCAADPFTNKHQEFCYLEYADDRVTRINTCITGGNASNASQCGTAIAEHSCISNPFADICKTNKFATHHVTARANRIVFCADPTNSASRLCTGDAVANICGYDPFHAVCFAVDNPDDDPNNNIYATNRTDKINFCGVRVNKDDPSCKGTRGRVTSANLLQSFTEELSSVPSTTNRRNQFLKDLEDESAGNIDIGDILGDTEIGTSGSLNLSTATFNGRALGGDVANGVAHFYGRVNRQGTWYHYSGIFSGTDLGAPVTQRSGTASWVGRFQTSSWPTNKEFVLEIDFNGIGDKSGFIKAFVQNYSTRHFYLDGSYDAHGVITGTADFGSFANNDRDDTTVIRYPGTLTGLIGKEGAVGAFISDRTSAYTYSGGFVARPPTTKGEKNETTFLRDTCTTDPFHQFCHVDYKTERGTRIEECIDETGSANNNTRCANAITRNPCILNPFADICTEADGGFATYYAEARANRATFCNGANNATNRLCTTGDLSEKICTYDPFTAICLTGTTHKAARETRFDLCNTEGASNLHCKDAAATRVCDYDPFNKICFGQGNGYDTARTKKITTTCKRDADDPSCYGAKKNPNAVAWADSFATTLSTSPDTKIDIRGNQFLKGVETALSNVDVTRVVSGSLNLATATFGGNSLGGDASDGVEFFRGRHSDGTKHYYAGILSGTDLGGPVTQTTGYADWKGSFLLVSAYTSTRRAPRAIDFTLEVNFGSTDNSVAGDMTGIVVVPILGTWVINGTFNDKGIITGDIVGSNLDTIGIMTGLIGQQGAVGAFYGIGTSTNYSGGFVACPYDDANNRCQQ